MFQIFAQIWNEHIEFVLCLNFLACYIFVHQYLVQSIAENIAVGQVFLTFSLLQHWHSVTDFDPEPIYRSPCDSSVCACVRSFIPTSRCLRGRGDSEVDGEWQQGMVIMQIQVFWSCLVVWNHIISETFINDWQPDMAVKLLAELLHMQKVLGSYFSPETNSSEFLSMVFLSPSKHMLEYHLELAMNFSSLSMNHLLPNHASTKQSYSTS
jgi:hypothetical protein